MTIQHRSIPDAQLHEAKGAASASVGQVLTAVGDGTATFQTAPYTTVKVGYQNYADTATQSVPIDLTVANTDYQLTNNGLGATTQVTYATAGVDNLWNVSTNQLQFSSLQLGDTVDLRVDVEVTTASANNAVKLSLQLGVGGTPYTHVIGDFNFKNAGAHKLLISVPLFIGDTNTKNNTGKLFATNDTVGSTLKVNGFFIRTLKRA